VFPYNGTPRAAAPRSKESPMTRPRLLALALLLLAARGGKASAREAATDAPPTGTHPEITAEDVKARIAWLACDALAGRMSLEPGAVRASQYVADELARMGYAPAGEAGTWFQPFDVDVPALGASNALRVEREGKADDLVVEKDWNPFAVSPPREAKGGVVFAGYGITAPEKSYDDYAGLDAKGKVVLVLRREPPWGKAYSEHATFLAKLGAAARHEAAALLVVNDPRTTGRDEDRLFPWSAGLGPAPGSGKIPMAFVSRAAAERMLAPLGASLEDLQKRIDGAKGGPAPASAEVAGVTVTLRTAVETRASPTRNVAGFLEGSDPERRKEIVVLGAHYDHVGRGVFGSNGTPADVGKIHPGADDNASGTAVVLEVAEALAAAKERPKRSVLVIAFSGEEMGLLGSKHWVAHPTKPLGDVATMVNLDMVGRLDPERGVEVGGVGTGEHLQEIVAQAGTRYGLDLKWDPQGVAPTDSTSFFERKVPVLWFFTGLHGDYHTPRDTADHVEAEGARKIGALTLDVVRALADREERVAFTTPPKKAGRPVLGVTPGEGGEGEGVRLDGVDPTGPAGKAGLLEGDLVTALDAVLVRSTRDLVRALGAHKPGDEVLVKVLREGKEKALKVVLGSR
jgi:hypothetical protein